MAEGDNRSGEFDDLFDDMGRFFDADEQGSEGSTQPTRGPAEEPARAADLPDPHEPAGDETRELTGPEWDRLRDVLGDEGEGDQGFEYLDDAEASESLLGDDDERDHADAATASGPTEGSDDDALSIFRGPLWDERAIADVEAAADQLVQEFGTPGGESEDGGSSIGDEEPPGEPAFVHAEAPDATVSSPATVETTAEPIPAGVESPEGRSDVPGGGDDDLLVDVTERDQPRTVKVGEPEELLKPQWQARGAVAVGRDAGPRTGRNLPAAVLTAVVLAVLGIILIAVSAAAFAFLAAFVILFAQFELYRVMQRKGLRPASLLGLIMGALVLLGAYTKGEDAMLFFVGLTLMACFLWYMAASGKAREGLLANIGVTMFGVVYVPFLAGYVLLILAQAASGRALMLTVLGLTFWYDIAAYAVGSTMGTTPLAPSISPKKSWQGLGGATLATIVVSLLIVPAAVGVLSVGKALALALAVVVFAPLGDLAESALKRDLGVKDMGWLLPGHGGALDRIDAALFVAPAAFYLLRLLF